MYTSLGQSSEIYHVHRESLAPLPQQEFNLPFASIDCDVVVLLACTQTQNKDTIIYLKGPDILDKKFIATRFFFQSEGFIFNFFGSFIKRIRSRRQNFSSASYRLLLTDITENHLERNIKTPETAYNWTNPRWRLSEEKRNERYKKLLQSFQSDGYNFAHPMHIMLCRSMGVKDKLNQGHHRIMFCKMFNIHEVSTKFISSAYMPLPLQPFFKKFIMFINYKQV
ncbi:hypothetical protein MSC41_09215 [Acinetobacter baumannii]|uniref:hypothetical protein n=1 Tax=Acinetobacter baumannii TaxID=470 RepID=UPI0021C09AA0|nr:hypothetical protein [Acinetobacter baumannii]MCT9263819.1 hypothetical protein [Acinetobacter baumannii]MDV4295821.1 hypothetical protein [Acinetobacter baumannii]